MRFKLGGGLLPLNLLAILLVLVIIFELTDVLRIILGLPFLLFFPGYALLLALFPRRDSLDTITRVALSFGMSIAVVPLIGLIINYTPWGIRLESVLPSIALFTLAMSVIGWFRLIRLEHSDRFTISLALKMPGWGGGAWDKTLSIVLIVAIVGALGALAYVIATPKVGEKFTEFYMLGESGVAGGYPSDIAVGEEARVIIGIVNHEQETKSYRFDVLIDGVKASSFGPIALAEDEKWENDVRFTPSMAGAGQKVEFILYEDGAAEPVKGSLHLWINVSQ